MAIEQNQDRRAKQRSRCLQKASMSKLHWQLMSLQTSHETISETVIVTITGFPKLMCVTSYLVAFTGCSCYIIFEWFNAFFLSLSGQLVQSSRRGIAQHKMGSTSLLCHKQIKVHNIMFVYKLGGYRNTVHNNNYITDTMLSGMSTIFRSWLDE